MKRNWFSNFIPFSAPMAYQGLSFRTPEHFYQAMKTLDFKQRAKIAAVFSPAQAKQLGKKVTIRNDWGEIKVKVMEYALRHKFSDARWLNKLRRTNGPFVEWNYWHDNFWGHCCCKRCENRPHLNNLGKLIDKLQREFA